MSSQLQSVLVIEHDAHLKVSLPRNLAAFDLPETYDICIITEGLAPPAAFRPDNGQPVRVVPIAAAIEKTWSSARAPGTYGYFITRKGAAELLKRTSEDGYFGDIDWRIIAYCVSRDLLSRMPPSFAYDALKAQHDIVPERPAIAGFCFAPGLVSQAGFGSVRLVDNRSNRHAHMV